MTTLLRQAEGTGRAHGRGPMVSAAVHLSVVSLLLLAAAKAPRVVPVHNPGTAEGKHVLLTYTTGAERIVEAMAASSPSNSLL